jgi:hypothetical protein
VQLPPKRLLTTLRCFPKHRNLLSQPKFLLDVHSLNTKREHESKKFGQGLTFRRNVSPPSSGPKSKSNNVAVGYGRS